MSPLRPTSILSLAGRAGRTGLQEGARTLVGSLLEGRRKAEPLRRGHHWDTALMSAAGEVRVGRPGVEVAGDTLRGARGGAFRCQVPHDGEYCPCGESPRPWRGVYLDAPLRARAPQLGCVEHPSDHFRSQD